MKKLFIILLLSYVMFGSLASETNNLSKVQAVSNAAVIKDTGHSGILELEFVIPYTSCYLLKDMPDYEISRAYDNVPKRAFGWGASAIVDQATAKYVSEIIFSKANSTSSELCYKYNLTTGDTEEYTVSTSGNIALKFSGKIKGVTATVDGNLKREVLLKTKHVYEEKTSFEVKVPKGKKVTLRVTGDCYVSNGVGKYYFFGIPFNKGTWEYITKTTEYYELYEENL